MPDPPPGPNEPGLEEVWVEEEPADARASPVSLWRRRREPVVVVALLKTLAVVAGALGVLLGIGTVVAASLRFEGWNLVLGTVGGVVVIFLGVLLALALVALAHLVDASYQALEHLSELNAPGRMSAWTSDAAHDDQVALLREIRDAVRLTDAQKVALERAAAERDIRALVETIDQQVAHRDFAAARAALASLLERHPEAPEAADAVRRIDDAEASSRESTVNELVATIHAHLTDQAWTQAAALADELIKAYPDDPRARDLRDEVRRTRDAATADERRRLYDTITALAREHRWREALDATSDLVEHFPDSPEAVKLRPRIGSLHKKAEVAERRRLLAEVREHSNAARWTDAYKAARELVGAYPDSAEASEVFGDLARLRRLAKRT